MFERFLVARGRLIQVPDSSQFAPLLNDYPRHLLEVRGLAAATVDQHIATTKRFLTPALLPEASAISELLT
jgi:integrase/recombinase XerD